MLDKLQRTIEKAYECANKKQYEQEIMQVMTLLNEGKLRSAEYKQDEWLVNAWVKKAIILYFMTQKTLLHKDGSYDLIPLKYSKYSAEEFKKNKIRMLSSAVVRYGAYIGKKTIIMPSFVNIGAYIGEGCMIDTWATVGSCAQIGNNVHLSGGVGIGGVLEPVNSSPTIIEDNCFIGARSEVVDGVIVRANSVLGMGVYLSKSTKIFDARTKKIHYGVVPPYSVVIPGSVFSAKYGCNVYAAIIIKKVDNNTLQKVSINELLRS